MASRHTPGPWRYDHPRYVDCEQGMIASTYSGEYTDEDGCCHPATLPAEANAYLIAAAPDLYEAATQALAQLAICRRDLDMDAPPFPAEVRLRAALRRAAGEETT